jgi:hypothetical protein
MQFYALAFCAVCHVNDGSIDVFSQVGMAWADSKEAAIQYGMEKLLTHHREEDGWEKHIVHAMPLPDGWQLSRDTQEK